jgi:cell division protein FtsB
MTKQISIKFSGYYVNGEKCDREALNKAIAELNEENEQLKEEVKNLLERIEALKWVIKE